ncbi:hypothetical protein ACJ41O_005591 [Fusarium nematophilum]
MFRASSRSIFHLASRASSTKLNLISQTSPRFALTPLLHQPPRAVFSSKSGKDPPPSPHESISQEHQNKVWQQKLESDPSKVSTQSSVRHVVEEAQAPASGEHDMAEELRHDIGVVKDTFRFRSVPRESHILGLAGTLPYLGTSLSTVFLAWDLNKEWPTGNAFYDTIFVDHETAQYLLSVIEPLQLAYGAGLEYAEKQPLRERTRFRYGMGLAASIIAWPTLFLPVEYALTTQFMAFVALYFADSRAATRGWAPHWYGTYRFLLTAMVGLAIFVSLVGRAKITQGNTLSSQGLGDRMSSSGIADKKTNWTKLEQEEKERIRKEKKEKEKQEAKAANEDAQKKKVDEMQGKKESKDDESQDQGKQKKDKDDEDQDQGQVKKDGKDAEDQEQGQEKDDKDDKKDADKEDTNKEDKESSAKESKPKDDKSEGNKGKDSSD